MRHLTSRARATTANCLTLDNTPVARNTVQAVSAGSITVVNAGTWASASAPYALRRHPATPLALPSLLRRKAAIRLTLSTQGVDLTQMVNLGDTYEILPLETLGSLWGTTSVPFQTGASASTADNVELWNGSGWLTYYPNGTAWKQAGSLVSQNNTLLASGAGWLTLRRGTTPITLYIVGRVPEVALRQFTTPGVRLSWPGLSDQYHSRLDRLHLCHRLALRCERQRRRQPPARQRWRLADILLQRHELEAIGAACSTKTRIACRLASPFSPCAAVLPLPPNPFIIQPYGHTVKICPFKLVFLLLLFGAFTRLPAQSTVGLTSIPAASRLTTTEIQLHLQWAMYCSLDTTLCYDQ